MQKCILYTLYLVCTHVLYLVDVSCIYLVLLAAWRRVASCFLFFFPFLSFSWFSMWLTVCMLITIVLHSVMHTRDLYAKHKMCWPQAKLVVDNYIELLRTYCGCIFVISFVDYLTACYMNSLKFFRHITYQEAQIFKIFYKRTWQLSIFSLQICTCNMPRCIKNESTSQNQFNFLPPFLALSLSLFYPL